MSTELLADQLIASGDGETTVLQRGEDATLEIYGAITSSPPREENSDKIRRVQTAMRIKSSLIAPVTRHGTN